MRPECDITEDELNALVDNELTGREQRRVAAHIVGCESCSAMLGGILAGKRLLSVKMQPVDPPASSWTMISANLDEIDSLAHATRPITAAFNLRRVPALAVVGVLLMLVATVMHLQRLSQPVPGIQFARAHMALASNAMRFGGSSNTQDVVTSAPGKVTWEPIARALMPIKGEIAEHILYRVDRTPISQFILSAQAFSRRGLQLVDYNGSRFFVGGDAHGALVAWESRGMVTILVGRNNPAELLNLAMTRQGQHRISGGM